FRNSLIPTVNLLGVNVGWLIGGTVVVENVFSIPGLGSLLGSAIFARDHLVVQAVTLILAIGVVLTNFIVDVATVALVPRIEPLRPRSSSFTTYSTLPLGMPTPVPRSS